jgi:hypothetical protein
MSFSRLPGSWRRGSVPGRVAGSVRRAPLLGLLALTLGLLAAPALARDWDDYDRDDYGYGYGYPGPYGGYEPGYYGGYFGYGYGAPYYGYGYAAPYDDYDYQYRDYYGDGDDYDQGDYDGDDYYNYRPFGRDEYYRRYNPYYGRGFHSYYSRNWNHKDNDFNRWYDSD